MLCSKFLGACETWMFQTCIPPDYFLHCVAMQRPLSGCETRHPWYLHIIIPCAVLIQLVRTRKNTHTKWKTITMVVGMYSSEPRLRQTINRTAGILRRQAETYIFTFTGSLGACIVLAIREWHMTCLGGMCCVHSPGLPHAPHTSAHTNHYY